MQLQRDLQRMIKYMLRLHLIDYIFIKTQITLRKAWTFFDLFLKNAHVFTDVFVLIELSYKHVVHCCSLVLFHCSQWFWFGLRFPALSQEVKPVAGQLLNCVTFNIVTPEVKPCPLRLLWCEIFPDADVYMDAGWLFSPFRSWSITAAVKFIMSRLVAQLDARLS